MTADRDHRRPQLINWRRLADAETFYTDAGYVPCAVPWVADDDAYRATLPPDATPYATLGGFLVASGEQSFLQLLADGNDLGKRQATTPCFRDEPHNDLHDPYFMKVELVRTDDTSDGALHAMVACALELYGRYVPVRIDDIVDGTYDIVDDQFGIELGSYGRRHALGHTLLYGTGLAEPRLDRVLERHAG